MTVILYIAQFLLAVTAVSLIALVTTQTSKESGLGALGGGGGDTGGSRFKGGVEEKIDNITKQVAYAFLVLSAIVAILARNLT